MLKTEIILESVRLISDIIDICGSKKLLDFIVTIDIEKAFHILDYSYTMFVEKELFRIKVSHWSKSPSLPDIGLKIIIRD